MSFTANIKCLCNTCGKKCSGELKSELAMNGKLTFLYMKNGGKLTHTCVLCTAQEEKEHKPLPPIFLGREGLLRIS
jgi:hypothetical protein